MGNIFDTPGMAAGYANARPPVHPHIIEGARKHLRMALPAERALDVGCGAGLSTRALQGIARQCLGIDPSAAMVNCAASLVPGASFMVGNAEELPVPSASMNLITAAGSLNYADLSRFFPEAVRALAPGGVLVVYDFSQGRCFRDAPDLDSWFSEFLRRYPMPTSSARELNPEILKNFDSGLRVYASEQFEIGLPLSPEAYLKYVLTETNVAHAIEKGTPEELIRSWCAETLAPVFGNRSREILFRGYFACMSKPALPESPSSLRIAV
jgi:ubiquinone/menaquinone biosynthesis C-methylase UbiE